MNIDANHEDRLMAALCHASAMIPLMGMMVPIAAWFSQREHSPLLRFQAIQALVYQILGIVAYFLLGACSMLSMLLMFPLPFLAEALPQGSQSSPQMVLMLVVMGLFFGSMLLISVAYALGAPLYMLIALVAGWRILGGHDFHYPLLGRLVERWTAAPPTTADK